MNRAPVLRLFRDKLIIDSFAGGGGASCGIHMALGRGPDIAINHDAEAISMHAVNHPETTHYVEDVWAVDPVKVCNGKPVGLMWLSPDCKHFSKAKGGRPVQKKIRGLAWIAVKWARLKHPDVIILENVEEFAGWGPVLDNGQPCPIRKGRTFKRFVRALRNEGYEVDWREMRASDYGTPTSRNRLFLIARCDGLPIVWPEPTHGRGLLPYRTAAQCIDWSIPTRSIFLTKTEAKAFNVKRPLAENTMRRIARGIQKFVINAPDPFIVRIGQTGGRGDYSNPITQPLTTVVSKAEHLVIAPCIAKFRGDSSGSAISAPLPTITGGPKENPAGAAHALAIVAPLMVPRYGERAGQQPRAMSVKQPMPTVVPTQNGAQLVSAFLAKHYGDTGQRPGSAMDEPVATITACDHNALVAAHISPFYGLKGNETRSGDLFDPLPTVTADPRHALVASNIVKLKGTCKDGQAIDEPLHTVQASGNHYAQVQAFLARYNGQSVGQTLHAPMSTLDTTDRIGLVTVRGEDYVIVDIGMRMLAPRELFRAQGFPDTYVIDRTAAGVPLTKDAQVRMCGNSVCPPLAAALIAANFAEQDQREVA